MKINNIFKKIRYVFLSIRYGFFFMRLFYKNYTMKRGVDLLKKAKKQKVKIDLTFDFR